VPVIVIWNVRCCTRVEWNGKTFRAINHLTPRTNFYRWLTRKDSRHIATEDSATSSIEYQTLSQAGENVMLPTPELSRWVGKGSLMLRTRVLLCLISGAPQLLRATCFYLLRESALESLRKK